ncbi:hypothetical protein KNP414_00615 [Paenibacillus mucilaginosus KNP414]|uniref:Uncharacterized protein n=1 Tax=Paenibacillus mucilaginosus (strain KNP414) TaxID=1036673 RepID=F8FQF8_PAEMK|nr:hypothetical protein KNP414_00615 [Paenibacillus mucilaginosus KNP414]
MDGQSIHTITQRKFQLQFKVFPDTRRFPFPFGYVEVEGLGPLMNGWCHT